MTPDPSVPDPSAPDPSAPGASSPGSPQRVPFSRRATGLPTMAGVAAVAGVSLKTVSRVINAEPGVRPETIAAVRTAAKALGYRRNDAASDLARASAPAGIGLIIEDITDPFSARLTRGVEDVARANGHFVMLSSSHESSELERTTTLALSNRGVAGMIVVPHSDDHHYLAAEIEAGLSIVFVDRPPLRLAADCVLSDNVEGARQAVAHLLDKGHRRIAFIGNETGVYTSAERLRGFRSPQDAVDDELVILGPSTEAESAAAVEVLLALAEPPTALFTQNNLLTMGAWRAIRASGIPIELVGFDDFAMADVLDPPVTVVAQDPTELGRTAARLLFERLAGDSRPPRRVVIPTRLIVRPAR